MLIDCEILSTKNKRDGNLRKSYLTLARNGLNYCRVERDWQQLYSVAISFWSRRTTLTLEVVIYMTILLLRTIYTIYQRHQHSVRNSFFFIIGFHRENGRGGLRCYPHYRCADRL